MTSNSFHDLTDFMNQMKQNIKLTLNQIQELDITCLKIQIQLQQKRDHYLNALQQIYSEKQLKLKQIQSNQDLQDIQNFIKNQDTQLKEIQQLQMKLKELTREKILKAEQITNKVEDAYLKSDSTFVRMIGGQPIDQQYNLERKQQIKAQILQYELNSLGLKKKKGRQKIINHRVQNIYEKYYEIDTQENSIRQQYCICSSVMETEPMIMCQNQNCPVQWYHIKCIGLQENNIPTGDWFCHKCLSQIDRFNKIKFSDKPNQFQVDLQFQGMKSKTMQNSQQKRGRGKPKKLQLQPRQLNM